MPVPAEPDPRDHQHSVAPGHSPSPGSSAVPVRIASSAPTDLAVRLAAAADADAIGAVQSALWRSAYAGILSETVLDACTPEAFAAAWRESLRDAPARHAVVLATQTPARGREEVVGLAVLVPSDDKDADDAVARLELIGVHPDHRHAGHGSRLVNATAKHAAELGFDTLTSWVLINHEELRGFLAAAGLLPDRARRVRELPADPGDDDHRVMEVRLVGSLSGPQDDTPRSEAAGR